MPNNIKNDRLLVIGTGFIGLQIADFFANTMIVLTADFPQVDITDEESLRQVLEETKPTILINCAAFADTHAAEKTDNRRKAFDVNVHGPANLMLLSARYNYRLVHIATGMIYDGQAPNTDGFRESDTPNPTSYYAFTKAWADAALTPFVHSRNILITRIHLPISPTPSPRNLLTKMIDFDSFATDQSSMIVIDDYLSALKQLLAKNASGIYHIVNPGTISFYTIAQMLQKKGLIDSSKKLGQTTIDTINIAIAAKGGAVQTKTILDTKALAAEGIVLRPISEAIEDCITKYNHLVTE